MQDSSVHRRQRNGQGRPRGDWYLSADCSVVAHRRCVTTSTIVSALFGVWEREFSLACRSGSKTGGLWLTRSPAEMTLAAAADNSALGCQRAPSPTTMNGTQLVECASRALPLSMNASIDQRKPSTRPTLGSDAISLIAPVLSFTVASELTDQCDSSKAQACA